MVKNWPYLGLIAFGALYYYFFQKADEMHAKAKYTIGYPDRTRWSLKSGKQVHYQFEVQGQQYKGGDDEEPNMDTANGRYLVKFDSTDPEWNAIYFLIPIPDSIGEAPARGWSLPPFEVPQEVLQK